VSKACFESCVGSPEEILKCRQVCSASRQLQAEICLGLNKGDEKGGASRQGRAIDAKLGRDPKKSKTAKPKSRRDRALPPNPCLEGQVCATQSNTTAPGVARDASRTKRSNAVMSPGLLDGGGGFARQGPAAMGSPAGGGFQSLQGPKLDAGGTKK
jgi:hypothetical protein